MAKKAPRKDTAAAGGSPRPAKPEAKSLPEANPPRLTAPRADSAATIRMYCHGLGDCFLLTFPSAKGGKPVRVMIDCGILQHAPGEAPKLQVVAQNLLEDTEGYIDLLVVTHEHWDHVAGFSHSKDLFEKIEFGQVWLSWAESVNDSDALIVKADLGKKRNQLHAALKVAHLRMKAAVAGDPSTSPMQEDVEASRNILAFFGPPEPEPRTSSLAAAKTEGTKAEHKMSLGQTMDWLRGKVNPKNFCSPGECRALPGADGVKVYVLGPPRDSKMLRKMDPTGDQGYQLTADRVSHFGAIDAIDPDTKTGPASPFDKRFRVSLEKAANDKFFQDSYGFPNNPLGNLGTTWRRIDNEWLIGGMSRLALQLDVGVNNTSLALVFELPDGRTLIFPGDAQMGNWMSWDDVTFKDEAGKELTITSKDLLNRAVFYKVGHHGSHNATRRVGGLEEMKSGTLVVMIPTDEKFALTQSKPHGWKMPAHGVNEALKKFSSNRILRADRDRNDLDSVPEAWGDDRKQVDYAPVTFGDEVEDNDAAKRPIWVEYTVLIHS